VRIAVQTCVGLFNREENSLHGPAYALLDHDDEWWLTTVTGLSQQPSTTPIPAFLARCFQSGVASGRLRYSYAIHHLIVPNLLTVAAVLDAVPLEDGDPVADSPAVPVIFDAVLQFPAGTTAFEATQMVFDTWGNRTTTMSKMNPGLDVHHHPIKPGLVSDPNVGLADYVVKARLFNFFLNEGCIPHTREHALMERMVANSPFWPHPIAVLGYDDTFGIIGDLFEAETTCVGKHNMGQVASSGVNNLAFFSRKAPITKPLLQNPTGSQTMRFNASKTYLTLIVGDGDNIAFMKGSRKDWMKQRVERCGMEATSDEAAKQEKASWHSAGKAPACFPLVWTASPQLLHLAPDMLRWYYSMSYKTGRDYFVLPPSGDLYSYPAMMPTPVQDQFISNTEHDGILMNTSGTVDWEWFTTWSSAIKDFIPRYSQHGVIRGIFPVNVPFNLPVLAFKQHEFYKVLGNRDGHQAILFKPREWRSTHDDRSIPLSHHNTLSVHDMAAEVNSHPRGTLSSIYVTSDGGARLEDLFNLIKELGEHVEVVDHETLVDLVLAKESVRKIAISVLV